MLWSDRDPPDTLGVGGVDSRVPLAAHQPGLLRQVAPASEGWPGGERSAFKPPKRPPHIVHQKYIA